MSEVKFPAITVSDYEALPETGPRYQLVEGELIMTPAPDRYHQEISGRIEFLLRKYLEDHPIGKLYDAPFDVYLSETNVFQPDILFIAKKRLAILSRRGAEGAPNLVVEILSPRTAGIDTGAKKKMYAQSGAGELWIVDPETKQVQIYELKIDPEFPKAAYREGEQFSSPLFPGLEIDVAEIFRE